MEMRINCYVERTESATYDKNPPIEPLESTASGGSTYLRFGEGDKVPIHRLTVGEDGIVRREWAYGKWGEAENLDYIPTTETTEIEE